jgi:hypothetical protein
MELSLSWEAANCASTQELPSISWNPKVRYFFWFPLWSLLCQRKVDDQFFPEILVIYYFDKCQALDDCMIAAQIFVL